MGDKTVSLVMVVISLKNGRDELESLRHHGTNRIIHLLRASVDSRLAIRVSFKSIRTHTR